MSLDPLSGLDAPAKRLTKSVRYIYREPAGQSTPVTAPPAVQNTQLLDGANTVSVTYTRVNVNTGEVTQITYEEYISKKGGF
jgi:hypothetical protein